MNLNVSESYIDELGVSESFLWLKKLPFQLKFKV